MSKAARPIRSLVIAQLIASILVLIASGIGLGFASGLPAACAWAALGLASLTHGSVLMVTQARYQAAHSIGSDALTLGSMVQLAAQVYLALRSWPSLAALVGTAAAGWATWQIRQVGKAAAMGQQAVHERTGMAAHSRVVAAYLCTAACGALQHAEFA